MSPSPNLQELFCLTLTLLLIAIGGVVCVDFLAWLVSCTVGKLRAWWWKRKSSQAWHPKPRWKRPAKRIPR